MRWSLVSGAAAAAAAEVEESEDETLELLEDLLEYDEDDRLLLESLELLERERERERHSLPPPLG